MLTVYKETEALFIDCAKIFCFFLEKNNHSCSAKEESVFLSLDPLCFTVNSEKTAFSTAFLSEAFALLREQRRLGTSSNSSFSCLI